MNPRVRRHLLAASSPRPIAARVGSSGGDDFDSGREAEIAQELLTIFPGECESTYVRDPEAHHDFGFPISYASTPYGHHRRLGRAPETAGSGSTTSASATVFAASISGERALTFSLTASESYRIKPLMKSTARRIEEHSRSGADTGRRRAEARRNEKLIGAVCGILGQGDPLSDLEAEHRAEVEADARAYRRT